MITSHALSEVVAVRGLPDSSHIVSGMLPAICAQVRDASSVVLLEVLVTVPTTRPVKNQWGLYCDELYLSFMTYEPDYTANTRNILQSQEEPSL
jgi:hypothetical protein